MTHGANTAVGSATKPVYIASDGKATPITHSINADVPANAKFTDTTYSDVTQSAHGLMTAVDKKKLDGIDLSKYLPKSGGVMTGNIDMQTNKKDILVGTHKATASDGTAVAGGTINTDKNLVDLLPTMRSYIGTYNCKTSSRDDWFDLISVRHRNGYTDGSHWGMMMYAPMFGGDLRWNLNTNKDVWQGVRTLLDSVNYTRYALAKDGTAKKAETLTDSGWIIPTFPSGIKNSTIRYRKQGKIVSVSGYVIFSESASAKVVLTLPEGYRPPAKIQQFNAADGSAQASFLTTIDTNGKVNFVGKTQGFFTTATEYYIHCTFFVD